MDDIRSARPAAAVPHAPLVLLATSLGVLIAQVDTSVVSLAVKRIGADLGSTVSAMQWMIDAYNLAYASFLLTGGALGDLFGRRRIFLLGVALFAAGSVACALAPDTATLLAGRAVSGIGAALELPMSLVLLTAAYPQPAARRHALGVWASCNGLAFIIGPTLGGLLVERVGWRSIFYLVLPLCAAVLALAPAMREERAREAGRRLDLPGQAAGIAALGGFAFAAIEGARLGGSSPVTLAAALMGVLGSVAFVRVERGSPRGLVPFGVFASRPFSASLAVAGLMTFGMYALLFLMPLYFQVVHGATALGAGLRLLPLSVAFVAVSQASGRIIHAMGFRATMAAGMAAMGVGELLCSAAGAHTPYAFVGAALAIVGVGLGLNTAPVNNVAVAHVPAARSGTASGLLNTARMVGATLGIAILGALFAHFTGQSGAAERVPDGLRAALGLGGLMELVGAAIAWRFMPRVLPA
jgi:MFS transporter, DHA2 family, methylenomycin A resistance protein